MDFHKQKFIICGLDQGENISTKVWYLKCFVCTDSSDEQSAFIGLKKITTCSFINFLSLELNEFLKSEIKQKLSPLQKITCITGISHKKIINVFCVPGGIVRPTYYQSTVQIKYLVLSAWLSFLLEFTKQEKKTNQQLYLI